MAGTGYDISASDSSSATSGDFGAIQFGSVSNGSISPVVYIVVGVLALFGLIIWLKKGKK